jgi:Peptidase family M23
VAHFERDPEPLTSHRKTARSFLVVLLGLIAGVVVQTAGAVNWNDAGSASSYDPNGGPVITEPGDTVTPTPAPKPKPKPKPVGSRIVFPVIGPVQYTNDFGDPRPQGSHQGNDIMAPKRSLAVAAESGKVKLRSGGAAGCYLYLYGVSKTTYMYIHLNNDRTTGNDNRGGCVPGVAYAKGLKDGQKVKAGQLLGYVGDSGDANGVASHLHFEVHPKGGAAVSPYPFLNRAYRLLFAAARGSMFTLTLSGKVGATQPEQLALRIKNLRQYPSGFRFLGVNRTVQLLVPQETQVERKVGGIARSVTTPVINLKKKLPIQVFTAPATVTLAAQMGIPGALSTGRVVIQK